MRFWCAFIIKQYNTPYIKYNMIHIIKTNESFVTMFGAHTIYKYITRQDSTIQKISKNRTKKTKN